MRRLIFFICVWSLAIAGDRRPFSPDDFREWRTASEPNICPDGSRVVWAEAGNLWVGTTDGRERRRFTEGAWHDRAPQWSTDGKRIAWISDRGGKLHLRIRPANGTAEREIPGSAVAFSWSPEGESIAFTAPPEGSSPAAAQVFVAPSSEGPARQLSHAATGCAGAPSWFIDGKSLVAACDGAVFSYRVQDGSSTRLTEDPGIYESPLVSPDGDRIAYLHRAPRRQNYVVRKLWVMNADGSRARVLSGTLDRDASDAQWSSEARTVYFLADDRGSTHIYAARNDGTVRQVTSKPERLAGFSLADNGRAVSIRSSAIEGGDVVTFTIDSVTQPVTLSEPNGQMLAERHIGAVEPLSYQSDGNPIQAWLVKPPDFDPAKKYPLLVDVADDPRRMYGVEFQLRAQILAAGGFVVLCANPRGAPGYGEQFGHLLRTRYPGDDFDDLSRGVDAAIAKGYIDPKRVSIAGGLVAAWAIGHSDRFARAVARRPIVDWSLDPPRAWQAFQVKPTDEPDLYIKRSPIFYAENFRTPTLVLAAESDPQSERLSAALRERKVEMSVARAGDPAQEIAATLAWLRK